MTAIAVEMKGINKAFGSVKALNNASLVVHSGTIHGLVGQNGAGKSTIIKLLAGIYRRDSGSVRVFGEELDAITPAVIEKRGVHFIHQDRLLVPTATIAEAIFLCNEPRIGPFINYRAMNRRASELLKSYFNMDIAPTTLISELSTAQQKIVQITRALAREAKVLVLDEPTAALVNREVENLFRVLERLKNDGLAIIFISHYMAEIEKVCDVVTVLRNGSDVGVVDPQVSGIEKIVEMMTDRDASEMYPYIEHTIGEPILEVENISLEGHFSNVSLKLHSGEILGLTGLLGSGDKELIQCLFGLRRPTSGVIKIKGKAVDLKAPADAVANGIAMLPEDRRAHGVAVGLSVGENISVASLGQVSSRGFISQAQEAEMIDGYIKELGIKTPDRHTMVRNLSGGNQQKVAVAKWLSCNSNVYLLDEPTVAVDVGAKVEIYNLMNRLATEGKGLVFVSSDLEEISRMCDRVLVIYRGELIREYSRGEVDADQLLATASGAADPIERRSA